MFGLFKRKEQTPTKTKLRRTNWGPVKSRLSTLTVGKAATVNLKNTPPASFRVMLSTRYGPGVFTTKKVSEGKYLVMRLK